jgi:hypothetical protein
LRVFVLSRFFPLRLRKPPVFEEGEDVLAAAGGDALFAADEDDPGADEDFAEDDPGADEDFAEDDPGADEDFAEDDPGADEDFAEDDPDAGEDFAEDALLASRRRALILIVSLILMNVSSIFVYLGFIALLNCNSRSFFLTFLKSFSFSLILIRMAAASFFIFLISVCNSDRSFFAFSDISYDPGIPLLALAVTDRAESIFKL